jgi:serine/threonine-protein kinase
MVTDLKVGMHVGRYRLVERIAQGGMGSVWCARDEQLERGVAVKLLPRLLAADPSAERRFAREARAMGRLQHPNVVSVYDVGSADPGSGEDLPFLVMELIRGSSLDVLLEEGPLQPERALHIMEQVCRALLAAHHVGVIHRDLKPSNIMICEDDHVKVLDFGLARLTEQEGQTPEDTLTTPGMVLGSCPYMAPEQALGQRVGPQSDIFSCGSVLYEALSGKRAFDGETPMRVLQAVVKCDFTPLDQVRSDLPQNLVKVVERCLSSEPLQRFSDCGELGRVLAEQKRYLRHSQLGLPPVSSDETSWLQKLATRIIIAAVSFAAGVTAGLILHRLMFS